MLYLVFLFIIILFTLLLLTKLNFSFAYIKNEQGAKSDIHLNISLFNDLISIKINPKVFKKFNFYNRRLAKGETHIESLTQRIFYWLKIYRQNLDILVDHRNYLNSKIKIKKYSFDLEYGTDDAALTGFLYGVAWSLATMTEAVLFRKKDIPDKNIKIDANFNKICFNLSFCCIFSLKTVHIIVASYKTLKWYFRRKINISKGGDVVG